VTSSSFYAAIVVTILSAGAARAEDLAIYTTTLKNHRFFPAEIRVPSGKPFFIVVTNADDEADEFEMNAPAFEKILRPGEQGKIRMRPLAPGRFPFFADLHKDTGQGAFISE